MNFSALETELLGGKLLCRLLVKFFFANGVLFDVVVKVLMTIGWISKHNLLWNVIPNYDG